MLLAHGFSGAQTFDVTVDVESGAIIRTWSVEEKMHAIAWHRISYLFVTQIVVTFSELFPAAPQLRERVHKRIVFARQQHEGYMCRGFGQHCFHVVPWGPSEDHVGCDDAVWHVWYRAATAAPVFSAWSRCER